LARICVLAPAAWSAALRVLELRAEPEGLALMQRARERK
jgi:hypothetical protein